MRDTTVSTTDLAIAAAKDKLATIEQHPGYAEAMRVKPYSRSERRLVTGTSVVSAALAVACWHYVTVAWLSWLLVVVFGAIAVLLIVAAAGYDNKVDTWPAAIVDKRAHDGEYIVAFLTMDGARREIALSEQIYEATKPGDVGVVHSTTSAGDTYVSTFERL